MSAIADYIGAPMSTLTNIVDKLIELKFLSREHSDDDRRVINVMLTAKGKTAFKTVSSKGKSVAENALSQFKLLLERMNPKYKSTDVLDAHELCLDIFKTLDQEYSANASQSRQPIPGDAHLKIKVIFSA